MNKNDVRELIGQMNDYVDFDPFIRVYVDKGNIKAFNLEVYGNDIPLPIDYDNLAGTIEKINGIDFEYEGVLAMYADPKYGERIVYSIGNKDRTDYTFSGSRLKEAINKAEED